MKVNADIFCLLNNDVEVTQDWTKPIMNEFGTNPIIAAIQPKILNYKNRYLTLEYDKSTFDFL